MISLKAQMSQFTHACPGGEHSIRRDLTLAPFKRGTLLFMSLSPNIFSKAVVYHAISKIPLFLAGASSRL